MKKKIYLAAFAALGLATASCSDFLDRSDANGSYSSDGFFSSDQALYDGAMGVYNKMYMNDVNGFYLVPSVVIFDHLTPMLLERTENTSIGAGNTLNPDNVAVLRFWTNCYVGIARANDVIFGGEANRSKLTEKGKQYLAEVHALRAYYYYILAYLYGDVPFFMEPVPDSQYDTAYRTSREKIIDDLIADLKSVINDLPWKREQAGRVNRGFAYGIIARLGLLGGSLDIGGRAKEYFTEAANAANTVITEGGYSLTPIYGDLFNVTGQLKSSVRDEIFYELPYTLVGTTTINHTVPFGQTSRIQGQTSRHISQMIADTYECSDGIRIDASPLYDNSHPQKNRDPRFSENIWMDGDESTVNNGTLTTQVISCYNDNTRLYHHDTKTWETVKNIDKAGASASWASFCNAGVGLMNGKYCHETAENISASTVDIIVMRYPELLLDYAEAKIELGETDASVINAINTVRRRAGVPDIDADGYVPGEKEAITSKNLTLLSTNDKLRQRVRRERKVELMTEGLHLFDMHRWKTGAIENKYPSYGCPLIQYQYQAGNTYVEDGITKTSLGLDPKDIPNFEISQDMNINDIPCYDAYKQKLKVRDLNRKWDSRFELFPIPTEELNRTKNLVQNPGYSE